MTLADTVRIAAADSRAGLREAWRELCSDRRIRNRDAAEFLGVSEAELVDCAVGDGVTRLAGDLRAIVRRAPALGPVMALTRNDACVHERDGTYGDVNAERMVGLVLGPDIDLRLFFAHWKHSYAVVEETPRGMQRSLQVFDAAGDAVHKIFLRAASDVAVYERIVDDLADRDADRRIAVEPRAPRAAEASDREIDVVAFRVGWTELRDTHEFFPLLRRFGLARTQALRLAPKGYVREAPRDAPRRLLEAAAAEALSIMAVVGESIHNHRRSGIAGEAASRERIELVDRNGHRSSLSPAGCAGVRGTPRPLRGCRTPPHCRRAGGAPWCGRGTTASSRLRRIP
jgi:putative hemin transport protein